MFFFKNVNSTLLAICKKTLKMLYIVVVIHLSTNPEWCNWDKIWVKKVAKLLVGSSETMKISMLETYQFDEIFKT